MGTEATSKPFTQFRTAMRDLQAHLEGVEACEDVAARILKNQDDRETTIGEALNLDTHRAIKLKRPVKDQTGFVNRLRKRNCEYAFHVLYSDFSEYLRRVLRAMYQHSPLMVAGKSHGKLDYHEIVKLGTFEAVTQRMVDQVFRRLEATNSPYQLLERVLDQTGAVVPEETNRQGVMYIEVRHLIVHNAGRVDTKFYNRNGDLLPYLKDGGKFQLSIGFARAAIEALLKLAHSMDTQLVSNGYLTPSP